jgi:MOSC domain-containing protein YiiM
VAGSIVQINVSKGGVPKLPVPSAILTPVGLTGDSCAHPQYHGGPNQALLLICSEVITELSDAGYPIFPGALGENLTTRDLDHRQLRIGQRYRIGGDVLIELTKIRVPCQTLNVYGPGIQQAIYDKQVKAGDPASPRWGMSGFYARVLTVGEIRLNDPISAVQFASVRK